MQSLFSRPNIHFLVTNVFILAFFVLSEGCSNNKLPDISNISVDVDIQRFEQQLFSVDTLDYAADLANLQKKFPDFFELFVEQLMSFGSLKDTTKSYESQIINFIKNKDIRSLLDTCEQKFNDLTWLENDLELAFRYFRYHLPNRHIPKIITHISAFNVASLTYDTTLIAINLDRYLGKNFPIYSQVRIPKYISKRAELDYIVVDALKAYAGELCSGKLPKDRLIDHMVREGKVLYFLDLCLPNVPDTIKIGYTKQQLDWCEIDESKIWAFFVENDWLYNSKYHEIRKFLNEAPTTTEMPPDSPGRVGQWVGWQIIRQLMKNNPDLSYEDLLKMKDGQQVLQKARYKPKRR